MKTQSLFKTTFIAFLLVSAYAASQAVAQKSNDGRNLEVDDYFAIQGVGNPLISPDGKWIVYSVYTKDLENDRSESRLWRVPTAGGEARPITARGSGVGSPSWTPDSQHLTFTARSKDQGSQIFKLDLRGGGERVQMTNINGGIGGHKWSPDRKRLLLSGDSRARCLPLRTVQ